MAQLLITQLAQCNSSRTNFNPVTSLRERVPEGLFWPPYSCDLNVLDRCIWGILDNRVNGQEYGTSKELEDAIKEEAEKLDEDRDLIRKCCMQFPGVVDMVIKAGGKNIDLQQFKKEQRERKRRGGDQENEEMFNSSLENALDQSFNSSFNSSLNESFTF